jgi:hypothetical protein
MVNSQYSRHQLDLNHLPFKWLEFFGGPIWLTIAAITLVHKLYYQRKRHSRGILFEVSTPIG